MKLSTFSLAGLILLNLFIIVYWFLSFDGFYFYDDLTYAKNALHLVNNTFSFSDNLFSQRIALIGATALSYYLFGVGDYATLFPPLLCTLISCNAIYFFLYKKNFLAALPAASVFAFDFYTIFFSNKLYPDVLVCCFVFLGLITLYAARESSEKNFLYALGVTIMFIQGYCYLYIPLSGGVMDQ
jgi:4-amino-4-deoxy-L-arabinose transferase-like glycosyltransferase